MVRPRPIHYAAAVVISCLAAPSSAQKLTKAQAAADAATPEQIASIVSVSDDSLDTVLKLSTEPFYVERSGLLKLTSSDKFLRAFIDKTTGETRFQVYIWFTYGGQWFLANRANYETPAGPASVEATKINSDVNCSRYGCTYREDVGFNVPEATLRELAAGAAPGGAGTWRFKISGRGGDSPATVMLKTEIAGLLLAVDQKRASLGLKAPQ